MGRGRLVGGIVALTLAAGAADAGAAVIVGHPLTGTPTIRNENPGSFVQSSAAPGAPSYVVPSDGVLTSWALNNAGGATGNARLKIVRPDGVGSGQWRVIRQSPMRAVDDGTSIIARLTPALPVQAGDMLALYTNGPDNVISDTPSSTFNEIRYQSGAGSDPGPGANIVSNLVTFGWLNIRAILDRDADGDGFGDESQDLCPTDATKTTTGCSGALLGSNLQRVGTATTCDPAGLSFTPCTAAMIVAIGGAVRAPYDGVIVRWRTASTGTNRQTRLRVLRPVGGDSYEAVATSEPQSVGTTAMLISTAPARIPVRANDEIGLQNAGGIIDTETAGQFLPLQPDLADGAVGPFGPNRPGNALVSADVERDADGDGFGDETQDRCPGAPGAGDGCPAGAPGGAGGGGAGETPLPPSARTPSLIPVLDTVAPRIAAVGLTRRRFALGRAVFASAAQRRAPRGTTVRFTLSGRARVTFTVEQRTRGRRRASRCVRGRGGRRCVRWVRRGVPITRTGAAGRNRVAFSGRFRRGALAPGAYRLTLVAMDGARNRSRARRVAFTIVRRR